MTTSSLAKPIPSPQSFTTAPQRNGISVQLGAPVPEVWALVGDLGRLPEYSAGLERVDVKKNASGAPEEYVCQFKPAEPGTPGAIARDIIRWYEENYGWASADTQPNDFGTTHSLHMVTLSPSEGGTRLKWIAHYDARDLDATRRELDIALADIAERLVARFGGRVVDRFVEGDR